MGWRDGNTLNALSRLVAHLVPRTRPNHCYPNRHPEKVEVMEKEEGDEVRGENGCLFTVNMARRGGPVSQEDFIG